jgi:hypothetical protein
MQLLSWMMLTSTLLLRDVLLQQWEPQASVALLFVALSSTSQFSTNSQKKSRKFTVQSELEILWNKEL